MEDKTPIFMVIIVAIVAIVGIIIVLSHNPGAKSNDDTITGNVVVDAQASSGLNNFGKVFFLLFLIGIAAYMYFRKDE